MQRMNAFDATLGPVDVQSPLPEINLRPTKLAQLRSTKAVSICQQDCAGIPRAIAASFTSGLD